MAQEYEEMTRQVDSYEEKCVILQKDKLLIEDRLQKLQVSLPNCITHLYQENYASQERDNIDHDSIRNLKARVSELLSSIKQAFIRSDETSYDSAMKSDIPALEDIILSVNKVKNEDLKGLGEHIQRAYSQVEIFKDKLGEVQVKRREANRDRDLKVQLLQEELDEKNVTPPFSVTIYSSIL